MSLLEPSYSLPYPRFKIRRTILRFIGRGLLRLLTSITIEGLENIPKDGPVILAGNHVSYIEPVLMMTIPKRLVEPTGAGDMPFEGMIDKLVAFFGFIPFNRGNLDRKGLNQALDVLKQGGVVGIFPEGGIWAPGQMPPQIGVALLSQRTGAPVVPIGFSGMQGSLKRAFQLKRPKLLMKIGKAIPALNVSDEGDDKDKLRAYARKVLDEIYRLISEDERNLIPVESRYHLSLEIEDKQIPDPTWGAAFARFLHSSGHLDSLKVNLKLPIGVLYGQEERSDAAAMQTALSAILDFLKVNPAFFTFRMGVEEGNQVKQGILELQSLLAETHISGKVLSLHTQETVLYRDGRLEKNEKRFLIKPGNQPG
jgi:1-acyl-sn-glycerol-3-phosphate acyltransferase